MRQLAGLCLVALVVALAACPKPVRRDQSIVEPGVATEAEAARRRRLIAELTDEILTSYERDELPEVQTALVDPKVGPARIGVGPGDVYIGDEVSRLASTRWPLQLEAGTPTSVRSKRLRVYLSHDRHVSAAWISDELSWRVTLCGRTAVMPLRLTALYAHDGDRWVQVFEHLSFGRMPQPAPDGQLRGKAINEAVVDRDLSDTLSRQLNSLISADTTRVKLAVAPGASEDDPMAPAPPFILGPDPDADWEGGNIESIRLVDGKLSLDRPRVGTIGRPDHATVAYWVGNLIADLTHPAGGPPSKVLLRGTFVFEKRGDQWLVVQGHISEPIDDSDLAQLIYGTALISDKPLKVTCDEIKH
jgi:ketosteroid isomerase-like protein